MRWRPLTKLILEEVYREKIDVDASLALILAKRKVAPDMAIVNGELKDAGWSLPDLMRLAKKMPPAVADYTDLTNVEVVKIRATS